MRRSLFPIVIALSALLFAGIAQAKPKPVKKLSDRELVDVLQNDPDPDRREDAAKYLGDRKVDAGIPYLSEACFKDPELDVQLRALAALEGYKNARALDEVQAVFEHAELPEKLRHKALKILRKQDPERTDHGTPHFLSGYRKLGVGFARDLLKTMVQRDRRDARDLPLLIATDRTAHKKVRLEALETAEKLDHPRIHEAYLSMLDDNDKKVRIRCIQGLSRSGLPGSRVSPALVRVVDTDSDGEVRAQALKALKFYATPELLPMLHREVLNETNPKAWGHALDLLMVVADESSVSTITTLLGRDEYLMEEAVTALIRTLVRIGDPSAVPALDSLQRRTQSLTVAEEAKLAIAALKGDRDQRSRFESSWSAPADVYRYDVSVEEDYQDSELSIRLDENGMVVSSDGTTIEWFADGYGAGVSVREERSGRGEYREEHRYEGDRRDDRYREPRAAPCEPAELRFAPVDGVWFDLYVNGEKTVEARAMAGTQRVGGLSEGSYHLRVTDFMGKPWSEQRVDVYCGDTVTFEVVEDQGLRKLGTQVSGDTYGGGRYAPPCDPAELKVSPVDGVWFDLYVNGEKKIEARAMAGTQRVGGLEPGSYHIRVTHFMGEVWSEGRLELSCGDQIAAEVVEEQGLRVLNRPEWYRPE